MLIFYDSNIEKEGIIYSMIKQSDIEDYESLLNKLPGVISSKIKTDANGSDDLTEIHILSNQLRNPKQISRDVQSALASKFGLSIDHKIISIAQIDDGQVKPNEFRLAISSIEVNTKQGIVKVRVTLSKDGNAYEGYAEGGNSLKGRLRVTAEATIKAIHKFLCEEYIFVLSDMTKISLSDQNIIAVSIIHYTDNGSEMLSGSSIIKNDEYESAVKAVLDAINRRLVMHCTK